MMENDNNYNYDELEALTILAIIALNYQREWEEMRMYDKDDTETSKKMKEFFDNVLINDLPLISLSPDMLMYRARQIHSKNYSELGVDLRTIWEEMYDVILSEPDKKELENMSKDDSFHLSPEDIYFIKRIGIKEYTNEQLEHISSVRKKYSLPGVYGFDSNGSGVPPVQCRKEGRLNTVSDAYLYLAFSKETALHEMRPSIGQQYSLATYKTNKEMKIVDLSGDNVESMEAWTALLQLPVNKISEPNVEDDKNFYYITQYMAHMIQKHGLDGIKYKSAMKKDGYNVLLFDDSGATFVSSEIIAINDISVDYSSFLPFKSE